MGKRVECARGRRPERGHVHLTVLQYCSIHGRACCNMNVNAACSCINLHNSKFHLVRDAVDHISSPLYSLTASEAGALSSSICCHTRIICCSTLP